MPVYPISFSIPESCIVSEVPIKQKTIATVIPGDASTYIFKNQNDYYKDYQLSIFGRTMKKFGWDCLRHYEILANGCIPYFKDIEQCPSQTMVHFPKDIVLEAMQSDTPEHYIPQLLDYTRTHLTCRAMAQYVFDTVGCPNPKRVLFLSSDKKPDYLRCLTLIGMKQILGQRCVESVYIPHIYEDYKESSSLYGKGFTYTNIVPVSAKPPPVHMEELQKGMFDIVVYGSIHRGMPYWDEVQRSYPPNKIVLLCGEDCDEPKHEKHVCKKEFADEGYNLFVRELV